MSDTVTEILACLRAWEPSARVLGNITAGNAIEAIERLRAALADAINRMDIAREIVRTPHGGNWAMLETDSLKAALAADGETT